MQGAGASPDSKFVGVFLFVLAHFAFKAVNAAVQHLGWITVEMAKSDDDYVDDDGASETSSVHRRGGGNPNETERDFELLRTWEEIGEVEGTLQVQEQSEANKRKR
jgi:hypothetical protein